MDDDDLRTSAADAFLLILDPGNGSLPVGRVGRMLAALESYWDGDAETPLQIIDVRRGSLILTIGVFMGGVGLATIAAVDVINKFFEFGRNVGDLVGRVKATRTAPEGRGKELGIEVLGMIEDGIDVIIHVGGSSRPVAVLGDGDAAILRAGDRLVPTDNDPSAFVPLYTVRTNSGVRALVPSLSSVPLPYEVAGMKSVMSQYIDGIAGENVGDVAAIEQARRIARQLDDNRGIEERARVLRATNPDRYIILELTDLWPHR